MIVLDASVLANALADDRDDGDRARDALRSAERISAPDLVDVETVAVLRRRWLARTLTDQRLASALDHLERLSFERVLVSRAVDSLNKSSE